MRATLFKITALLLSLSALIGEEQSPQQEKVEQWGRGVQDPEQLLNRLEKAIKEKFDGHYERIVGMYSVMSWQQATKAYRRASRELKPYLVHYLIGYGKPRFSGYNRGKVIATLGDPDARWEGEHGEDLVYTGEGHVSDSMSGYIFTFKEDGTLFHIISAN